MRDESVVHIVEKSRVFIEAKEANGILHFFFHYNGLVLMNSRSHLAFLKVSVSFKWVQCTLFVLSTGTFKDRIFLENKDDHYGVDLGFELNDFI